MRRVALAAVFAAEMPVGAQSTAPGLRVDEAWARRAVMIKGGDFTGTGAVYARLVNAGSTPDTLLAAKTDAADTVEIHETYEEGRLSRMRQVTGIDVAPGPTVELKPGGYHVMLINLRRDLKAGTTMPLTLVFRNAGNIAVTAQVR